VDGAQANDSRVGGMSAPKPWASAPKQALMGQKTGKLAKNHYQFHHMDIHASTRDLAGVVQTILKERLQKSPN
jgi:hypothetical protein